MDEKVRKIWEDFVNPQVMRPALIMASIYITGFELLKDVIEARPKAFFTDGFGPDGLVASPEYSSNVLSKSKSVLYASLAWLEEMGAIDVDDLAAFERIKVSRNKLTHELPSLLTEGFPADIAERFAEMVGVVGKIERWWIINIEFGTNPDMDDVDIDEAEITTGTVMSLRLMMDVALGSEEESTYYLKEFQKHRAETPD